MIDLKIGVISIRIIISPAKTMRRDNDVFSYRQMPVFLKETETLLDYLQGINYDQLKSIWKCSDKLAQLNFDRIKNMDLYKNLTPAIVSFEGLQYQYMCAGVLSNKELDYIEEHLRILSGFYGILRPFDGIVPYRLEMQAKPLDWKYKSLYDYWEDKIAKDIFSESVCIINLASKEYSKRIFKYMPEDTKMITCIFGELVDGRVVQKGTLAKMARGEMVRFMAENNIKVEQDIKAFNRLGYIYREDLSDEKNYIFIRTEDLK